MELLRLCSPGHNGYLGIFYTLGRYTCLYLATILIFCQLATKFWVRLNNGVDALVCIEATTLLFEKRRENHLCIHLSARAPQPLLVHPVCIFAEHLPWSNWNSRPIFTESYLIRKSTPQSKLTMYPSSALYSMTLLTGRFLVGRVECMMRWPVPSVAISTAGLAPPNVR